MDVKNDLEFVVAGENRYVQVAEGKLDMLFTWPGECWQLIGQNYDFRYIDGNPNGSNHDIAGITNERGNVVGLMPHPEHNMEDLTGPSLDGRPFFSSVMRYLSTRI